MKVAFVFSGQVRELNRRSESLLKKINEFNADVYGSFWDSENESEGDTIENFVKTYNPIHIEIESFDNWLLSTWPTIKEEHHAHHSLSMGSQEVANRPNIYSMWYKVWKANMLTKTDNIQYDVIVRLRTDIGLSDKFSVQINEFINFPHGLVTVPNWHNAFGMHDIIAYGNPQNMDYFSSLFLYMFRYLKEGVYFYPYENVLRHHLSQKSMFIRFYGDAVYLRDGGNFSMNEPDKPDWILNSRDWDLKQLPELTFYRPRA
jgi:hypothetical protein